MLDFTLGFKRWITWIREMKSFPLAFALLLWAGIGSADDRRDFIADTAREYGVSPAEVEALLGQAQRQESILEAISRPAEAKPWRDYRPIFLGEARIRAGRAFMREHAASLNQVQADTGVPAALITAIIGVETNYGRNAGSHRVLDALYTLGFHYPPRQDFFRRELAQLVALGREEKLDIPALKGSYAGAMGLSQFMPSSYRAYARDGDGDGRRDLFNSLPDIFASVANYFVAHGWQPGQPVVLPANRAPAIGDAQAEAFAPTSLEPTLSLGELGRLGFQYEDIGLACDTPATVIDLDGIEGAEHWIIFKNFHVITRYNRSKLYAMAVYQLSQAIAHDTGQTAP